MCFSLILLSVDLTSPHVKNKMSKREFIRNTRNAVVPNNNNNNNNGQQQQQQQQQQQLEPRGDELYGAMYDNVFLKGHVGDGCGSVGDYTKRANQNQFVPGYLALFL